MAARSSGRPAAGVYLCIFGSAGASTAAPTMGLGVGGAGAPAPNPMTGRPAAFSALAFASTARVADSEMADTRADILVVGMYPWWHLRAADHQLVTSTCPDDIQRTAAAATSRPEGASGGTGGRPSGRRTGA